VVEHPVPAAVTASLVAMAAADPLAGLERVAGEPALAPMGPGVTPGMAPGMTAVIGCIATEVVVMTHCVLSP
jgi:hypothetical protein